MTRTESSEADYDSLSWHDNHVHGLEIHEGEHGSGELILHLDHIVEWIPPVNGVFSFRVAPAILAFREVNGLKLELDYLAISAGMTPFSIGHISREAVTYQTGYASYRWNISINWPEGYFRFEAPGFTQRLLADPMLTFEQSLSVSARRAAIASFGSRQIS